MCASISLSDDDEYEEDQDKKKKDEDFTNLFIQMGFCWFIHEILFFL